MYYSAPPTLMHGLAHAEDAASFRAGSLATRSRWRGSLGFVRSAGAGAPQRAWQRALSEMLGSLSHKRDSTRSRAPLSAADCTSP
jgi:hypothetical protein